MIHKEVEVAVHTAMQRIQLLEKQMREVCERVRQVENKVHSLEHNDKELWTRSR